jgi:hypothetical protein
MGILSILEKGLKAMINEATTPESFKTGQKFEDYVRKYLFIERYYSILEKTHNYEMNKKDYILSSLNPDYKFQDKLNNKEFYVECKFRSILYENKFDWCSPEQLRRYQEINRSRPVFLLLGLAKNPSHPEFNFLIPLSVARYTGLYPSILKKYEIPVNQSISPIDLWQCR